MKRGSTRYPDLESVVDAVRSTALIDGLTPDLVLRLFKTGIVAARMLGAYPENRSSAFLGRMPRKQSTRNTRCKFADVDSVLAAIRYVAVRNQWTPQQVCDLFSVGQVAARRWCPAMERVPMATINRELRKKKTA